MEPPKKEGPRSLFARAPSGEAGVLAEQNAPRRIPSLYGLT